MDSQHIQIFPWRKHFLKINITLIIWRTFAVGICEAVMAEMQGPFVSGSENFDLCPNDKYFTISDLRQ